jgi:hypothetical protein
MEGDVKPSKLAETLAEIEDQGYGVMLEEYGWMVRDIAGTALLEGFSSTQEKAILRAYDRLFDNQGRAFKRSPV